MWRARFSGCAGKIRKVDYRFSVKLSVTDGSFLVIDVANSGGGRIELTQPAPLRGWASKTFDHRESARTPTGTAWWPDSTSTCALENSGALYCWGDNAVNQLGFVSTHDTEPEYVSLP